MVEVRWRGLGYTTAVCSGWCDMDQEKIIDKIKKCLALAKSDNPHEAATALRQAQKLMEQHNLTEQDISL